MTDLIEWYEWPDREDEYIRGRYEPEVVPYKRGAPEIQSSASMRRRPELAARRHDLRATNPSN